MNLKKNNNKLIICLIMLFIIPLIFTGCNIIPPIPNEAKWTVMVYMAAGNNLETVGIQDINEMELVGSTKDVNIVAQLDRIPFSTLDNLGYGNADDSTNSNWTGTRRYYITQDMNTEIIRSKLIEDLGEKNMGNPETLKDFAHWAIENYPAERYMLVLWNHGGGFRSQEISRDICWDYNFGLNSSITMPELEEALAFIAGQAGGKIDIIGMDACYMGMTEVAYQIKDYGNIMISSEASVPGNGWQYDSVLQTLVTSPNQTSRQFASAIVDWYYNQYSGTGGNVTLSAVDLRQIDSLANQLSGLSQAIMDDSSVPKNNYKNARNASQYYTGVAFEYIDLKDFVNRLSSYTSNSSVLNYASQIDQLMEKGNIIINNTCIGNSVIDSYGLSIYIPYYSYDDYYDNTNFAQEKLWDEMLHYLGY